MIVSFYSTKDNKKIINICICAIKLLVLDDIADDSQLQKSTPQNDVQSLTRDLESCTGDRKYGCAKANQNVKIKQESFYLQHLLCLLDTIYHRQSLLVRTKLCF